MTIENSHDKRMVYDGGVYRRKIFNFDEINPIFFIAGTFDLESLESLYNSK